MKKLQLSLAILLVTLSLQGQNFKNPILTGFNPDPSVCRVGDDYYLATSSFTSYPGIPVYHSKDLVNWKLIGHGINRPGMIDMQGLNDNDGIWAVTIRHYEGVYYLITTASKSGGNFYITATDPRGPWSDPVWLKNAPGIDPSLFWDDNGKCYYTGNAWDFKKSWPAQCGVWTQELDLTQGKLVGERKMQTYGHANNATYAEGPHIYKIDNRYLLLMSEGGTDVNHAVTVHLSNSLLENYIAAKINPILSHRQLGKDYHLQAIGHADLVQTQNGEWYAVVLGKRMIEGKTPLSRETFLCKVEFENGIPIFNPGHGIVLDEMKRPDLPWTPIEAEPARDEFKTAVLGSKWYFTRIPKTKFYNTEKGNLNVMLQPETVDSLFCPAIITQKIKHHKFSATTKLNFQTKNENEQAGVILYRTANGYYSMLKDKSGITLIKKHLGKKEIIGHAPYSKADVYMKIEATGMKVSFSFGETPENMDAIGGVISLEAITDNALNKFNGPGIGVYATSNGAKSKNKAIYDWFEYLGFPYQQ